VFDSFGDVLGSRDFFFVDLNGREAALPGGGVQLAYGSGR
jgi:hypothetical protein